MIIRTWHGRAASAADALAYEQHFRGNVLPELRTIPGFRGALLTRQDREDGVQFFVLTKWQSLDAIRAFAGDDVDRAVVEPEAVTVLASFDQTVHHYDVVDEFSTAG
jgi:heme-degrading monooxygenase HmoA